MKPHGSTARIGILVSQAGKSFFLILESGLGLTKTDQQNCPGVSLLPLTGMILTSGCPHLTQSLMLADPTPHWALVWVYQPPKKSALGSELLGDHSNQCGESRVALSGAS